MDIKEIVGLNTKYYRYKKGLTQEEFANLTHFKMAYISIIENGITNLTLNNIKIIADCLDNELPRRKHRGIFLPYSNSCNCPRYNFEYSFP